jgi:transcriptional regulator with XRE-family HTH domain
MSKITNTQALGLVLRNTRKRAGLTQEEAAQRIAAARTTIVAIEQGTRYLRACELAALARAYDVDAKELLRTAESNTTDESLSAMLAESGEAQKYLIARLLSTEPTISTLQAVKVLALGMSPAGLEDVACALMHVLIEQEKCSE